MIYVVSDWQESDGETALVEVFRTPVVEQAYNICAERNQVDIDHRESTGYWASVHIER